MTFLELQQRLTKLNLDNRTSWITGGTDNKEALNVGLKEVFEKFLETYTGSTLMRIEKTQLTFSGNTANLPAGFRTISKDDDGEGIFAKSGSSYYILGDTVKYRIQYGSPYKIVFETAPTSPIFIDYIANLTNLVNDADLRAIPESLHESICDFALVDYFRKQRDWNNLGMALQYAEGKIKERIDNIWIN